MGTTANANEIENRLIDFSTRIINFADALAKTQAAKHIASQFLRFGTSPAPNHAEASRAESNADFDPKRQIAWKELNQSCVWLKMICRAEWPKAELLTDRIDKK